jgi:hypothetical protein
VAAAAVRKWPAMYEDHKSFVSGRTHRDGGIQGMPNGNLLGTFHPWVIDDNRVILALFGQLDTGTHKRQVSYDALVTGFETVGHWASTQPLRDIAFPLLGCGLAGGSWSIVSAIIETSVPVSVPLTCYVLSAADLPEGAVAL